MEQNVSRRWVKKVSNEVRAEKPSLAAGKLADLMAFSIAWDAWMEWLESQGKKADSPLDSRAGLLVRKSVPMIKDAMELAVIPIVERPDAALLHTPLSAVQRSGSPFDVMRRQANFFRIFLNWLRIHPAVFQGLFSDGRSAKTARQLALVAQEDSPASRLNKVAGVSPASSQTLIRKWIRDASIAAGVPLSPL